MKPFFELTKVRITFLVLLSTLAGFCVSFPVGQPFDFGVLIWLLLGIYCVSSGSFAVNQAQEWRIDQFMPRTQSRPGGFWCLLPLASLFIRHKFDSHRLVCGDVSQCVYGPFGSSHGDFLQWVLHFVLEAEVGLWSRSWSHSRSHARCHWLLSPPGGYIFARMPLFICNYVFVADATFLVSRHSI